jgi:PBP1b-binding outer membrane lipoprotein LpoB
MSVVVMVTIAILLLLGCTETVTVCETVNEGQEVCYEIPRDRLRDPEGGETQ